MAEEELDTLKAEGLSQPAATFGASMPAAYANRFYLYANDQIMRFLIGDSVSGPEIDFKFSFVMTRVDAADLAKTIQDLLEKTAPKNQDPSQQP